MAHYAFINENNMVTEVIVGKDEDDTTDLEGFELGKPGMQTLEVRLVKELLTIQ